MTKVVEINIREMLPKIRKAFEEKELQMFTPGAVSCNYNGPCAIGVCFDVETQDYLEDVAPSDTSIDNLIAIGVVIVVDGDQEDIEALQTQHDAVCSFSNKEAQIEAFNTLLTSLEEKYA